MFPIGINSLLIVAVAIAYNNLTRHRYPHLPSNDHTHLHGTADAPPSERLGFAPEDLDHVLKQYNEVLDINRDDLEALFLQAETHAFRRRFGQMSCIDIMSRDVVSVTIDTSLAEAWKLLRLHKIRALPVIDAGRKVVGIITLADFMKHAHFDVYPTLNTRLRTLFRATGVANLAGKTVVERVMTSQVHTIRADMHVAELIPALSDAGLHHAPIVDSEGRLVGMVTQSDLIAALYRGQIGAMTGSA